VQCRCKHCSPGLSCACCPRGVGGGNALVARAPQLASLGRLRSCPLGAPRSRESSGGGGGYAHSALLASFNPFAHSSRRGSATAASPLSCSFCAASRWLSLRNGPFVYRWLRPKRSGWPKAGARPRSLSPVRSPLGRLAWPAALSLALESPPARPTQLYPKGYRPEKRLPSPSTLCSLSLSLSLSLTPLALASANPLSTTDWTIVFPELGRVRRAAPCCAERAAAVVAG